MHDDFEKQKYEHTEVPAGLYEEILSRIAVERRIKTLKRRVALFSACAIGSFAAFIPATGALWADISRSGFLQYASLLFSDPFVVVSSGSDYLLSLAESLPAFRASLFLTTIFLFFGSLKMISQNITKTLQFSHDVYSRPH